MAAPPKKTILIAPFWQRPLHVGILRVERMLRWLHAAGCDVVLVHAAEQDRATEQPWGVELAIRDPLRRYPCLPGDARAVAHHALKTNQGIPGAFKKIGKLLLLPDLDILWSCRIARHPLVLAHARGADCVISTSPPESAHLGGARLARKLGAKFIMDMRDGWLDEPLKHYLYGCSCRKAYEAMLEQKAARAAEKVLVTSNEWKSLLNGRLPFTARKTVVLTNSSLRGDAPPAVTDFAAVPVRLIYAGQFTHSKVENRAGLLLECLWRAQAAMTLPTVIEFYGVFNSQDIAEIARWERPFAAHGHRLAVCDPVCVTELRRTLREAHGTVLLSATQAAIVGKFFDCLASGRPVLAVTHRGSATWEAAMKVACAVPLDLAADADNVDRLRRYYDLCARPESAGGIPDEYLDPYAKSIFLAALGAARVA